MPSLSVPDNLIGSVTETLSGSFEGLGPVIYLVLGVYLGLFILEALVRTLRSFFEGQAQDRRDNRPGTKGVTQGGDSTIDLSGEADLTTEKDND